MKKPKRRKILLTILYCLITYHVFTLPFHQQVVVIRVSPEKTISTTYDTAEKVFGWIGLFFLALSVWVWREELKLTGFGFFSGESLKQQTPDNFREGDSVSSPPNGISANLEEVASQMEGEENEKRKKKVLSLLSKGHALNLSVVLRHTIILG